MADRLQLSDYVWLKPERKSEFDIPIAVRILNSSGGKLEVIDDDGTKIITTVENILKPLHATSKESVEDMITLGELQEYTILRNLHIRYNKQLIYTYTGSMLIAINPYEILPIYTMDQIHYYQERSVTDMPPHIFAIGSESYRELLDTNVNQCIDLLITYPFSQLSNWSSGNTFFHMTMGSFMRGTKILCETSLGYKMDDLISSYIAHLRQTIKQRTRKP
ncbi:unnamed protein product [Leptidea sinapis]|uniref:Myosin motor domain-containing protein n=1 Tax=Leptidea sinapis TaxID=189913 RepID=A0A5E4QID7_9NEOP|nr:unnamed protein product [Leptidea sinapis]